MNTNSKKRNSHVVSMNGDQIADLESILRGRGWEFMDLDYGHWKASGDKVTVAAYKSGKVSIQGKGTSDFVLFILEPEVLKQATFGYEDTVSAEAPLSEEFTPHAGVDESGKGDFFGPLVVASVFLDGKPAEELERAGVTDSKSIRSDKRILDLERKIKDLSARSYSVVSIGPEAYNRLYADIGNLNKLLAWGHARAIENVLERVPDCKWVLSDKFTSSKVLVNALLKRGAGTRLVQETRAERDIVVAAASILARARFIRELDRIGTETGIELPRGAGVKVERAASEIFREHGEAIFSKIAKIHFKTMGKIRKTD